MPLSFTQNHGQWDESILFRANAGRAIMWFAKDKASYQFTREIERSGPVQLPPYMKAGHLKEVEHLMINKLS